MRLIDPIDSVLKQKSREIWLATPNQSVYEAIEEMADNCESTSRGFYARVTGNSYLI